MKEIQKLLKPKVTEFKNNFPDSNPEIFNISYDLWT